MYDEVVHFGGQGGESLCFGNVGRFSSHELLTHYILLYLENMDNGSIFVIKLYSKQIDYDHVRND
jgi:hypothetical protein